MLQNFLANVRNALKLSVLRKIVRQNVRRSASFSAVSAERVEGLGREKNMFRFKRELFDTIRSMAPGLEKQTYVSLRTVILSRRSEEWQNHRGSKAER